MKAYIEKLVREALAEDVGQSDVTTEATVQPESRCRAVLTARQDGVLSGIQVFRTVFEVLDAGLDHWDALSDGASFRAGDRIATFEGNARAVLTGERVALNFVQRLSGVATLTAAYVRAVNGTGAKIVDTRKTTPLLRRLEKQAVMHGGGANHRFALFDGVLIKDNHIAAAGGITEAVQRAVRATHHLLRIEVEVTSQEEFEEALAAGADAILLDNMDLDQMRRAVQRANGTNVVLEASGNMTLDRVRAVAETGVHLISVGALTHSAPAVDLSLRVADV